MMQEKILVVEDTVLIAELVKKKLELSGYEVITARDGSEGLAKISKERPNLVLLDIKMEGMDGYTMLKKMKKDVSIKDTPVIVLTAYGEMKDLFAMEGVKDYILKPFDEKDFLSRISKALK